MAVIVTPDDPRDLTYDRQVARQFARLTSGWWRGATARRAWLLTIALASLVIANIGVNLGVNQWNRVFFDALERRDGATLGLAVAAFAGLVVVIAGIGVGIVRHARDAAGALARMAGGSARRHAGWAASASTSSTSPAEEPPNPEYRISDDSRWADRAAGRSRHRPPDCAARRLRSPSSASCGPSAARISFQVLGADHDPGLHGGRGARSTAHCFGDDVWVGAPLVPASRPQERGRGALPLRHDPHARQRRERSR